MLTKVNSFNYNLGTGQLNKYFLQHNFNEALDNLNGNLLVKKNNCIYVYNYHKNKYYNHNKIQIDVNGHKFVKQIDSFDQNNHLIANKIRLYVLSLIDKNNDVILGIGGEYYIYFYFAHAQRYIGMSNHLAIINDAKYNVPCAENYLVDYNNKTTYPIIKYADCIILNVFNIHVNIIEYIETIKFKKIIVIACNLPDSKMLLLKNKFKIKSIKYFKNIAGIIRVILLNNVKD